MSIQWISKPGWHATVNNFKIFMCCFSLSLQACGKIRAANGKAKLLVNKKFKQFKGLCDTNLVSFVRKLDAVYNNDCMAQGLNPGVTPSLVADCSRSQENFIMRQIISTWLWWWLLLRFLRQQSIAVSSIVLFLRLTLHSPPP